MNNTQDLSQFGFREKKLAAELLALYGTLNDDSHLNDGVAVEFNPHSANVFLVDEDYNVAFEFDGKLVDFLSCPNCGYENVAPEFVSECTDECCKEYFGEIEDNYK